MKIQVWTLARDGDEIPMHVEVYASEEGARLALVIALEDEAVLRCKDGHKVSTGSISELCELWEEMCDGYCSIDDHSVEIEIPPAGATS